MVSFKILGLIGLTMFSFQTHAVTGNKTDKKDAELIAKGSKAYDHVVDKEVLKLMEKGIPLSPSAKTIITSKKISKTQFIQLTDELKKKYKQAKLLADIKDKRYNFKKVDDRTMSNARSLLNLRQDETNLDLNNATYAALFNELSNIGSYGSQLSHLCAALGDESIANADGEKNSLGNLANLTIHSAQHRNLAELIKGRTDIASLPKKLGKELGKIAKNPARYGGKPKRVHIHVRSRNLGDYKGDLSTFLKELSEAGVTVWLHPNSMSPKMSMQELAEVSRYVAKNVDKGDQANYGKPLKHAKVQIVTSWKAIVDVELKNGPKFNTKYDSIEDSKFRVHSEKHSKKLKNAKEASIDISDIQRDYEIYKRFGNLVENGAHLHITFPAKLEGKYKDKDFTRLYNLYSAIGVVGKDKAINFYDKTQSHTTLYFNAKSSAEKKMRALNPRYKKPHLSRRFYEIYLNCLIELRDPKVRVSKTCNDLKQDGKILD